MSALEVSVTIEELRKRKILVATPMYGGMCGGTYTKSTADLASMAAQYGMDVRFYYLFNESLITRARNYLVDEFLRSNCTHLMFIDADIGFDPNDVIALSVIAEAGNDKEIVCGPYPKKCIAWEKIKRAVDRGFADKDPENLEKYVGDYVFNPKQGSGSIPLDEPVEVLEGGTGFMMIQRSALEKFAAAYPQYNYLPDHVRTAHFDGTREIMQYFQAEVDQLDFKSYYEQEMKRVSDMKLNDPEAIQAEIEKVLAAAQELNGKKSKRYLSEDYWFCQKMWDIGVKTWLCPWMKLQHMGSYVFAGSLIDLAQIGAGATADLDQMAPKKK